MQLLMTRQMISLCLECQKWDEESQLREKDFDIPTFFFPQLEIHPYSNINKW